MSDLQDAYLRHRADGLVHEQAVETIAIDTGVSMTTVMTQLEHQNKLDVKAGNAPRNWRRPRHRVYHAVRSTGITA